MTGVLGVDGWRGGWIGALVEDGQVEWRRLDDATAVVAVPAAVTAIDIPIGLPQAGRRHCDELARRELPGATASVFAAPVRPVLDCHSYVDARAVLRDLGGASMSAQASGIVAKVREVDVVMRAEQSLRARVIEVHPEIAFRRLAAVDTMARKRTASGVAARLLALSNWLPDVLDAVSRVPSPIPVGDALDALACAYVAAEHLAGRTEVLGGEPDQCGLPMQIVVPVSRDSLS